MRPLALVCLVLASTAVAQIGESTVSQVTVHSVRIYDSAHRLTTNQEQEIIADIVSRSYRADGLEEISERVRYAYQVHGFFKAAVDAPMVTSSQGKPQDKTIDVAVHVDAGEQYRINELLFTGAKVFPANELRSLFELRDGETYNAESIRKGLEELRKLYAKDGYINFVPVPNAVVDDQTLTISLTIELDEGKQFRVGKLIVNGDEAPEPPCKARLLNEWKRYEGQVYDPEILAKFLKNNSARDVTPERNSEIVTDASTAIVDVALEIRVDADCGANGRQ